MKNRKMFEDIVVELGLFLQEDLELRDGVYRYADIDAAKAVFDYMQAHYHATLLAKLDSLALVEVMAGAFGRSIPGGGRDYTDEFCARVFSEQAKAALAALRTVIEQGDVR